MCTCVCVAPSQGVCYLQGAITQIIAAFRTDNSDALSQRSEQLGVEVNHDDVQQPRQHKTPSSTLHPALTRGVGG